MAKNIKNTKKNSEITLDEMQVLVDALNERVTLAEETAATACDALESIYNYLSDVEFKKPDGELATVLGTVSEVIAGSIFDDDGDDSDDEDEEGVDIGDDEDDEDDDDEEEEAEEEEAEEEEAEEEDGWDEPVTKKSAKSTVRKRR